MYKNILILKGNYIFVVYTKMYETVAKMVMKYYDTNQFDETLFVINVLVDENSNDIDFRQYCQNAKKYIYYQLNNVKLHPEFISIEHMVQFDEIWDVSLVNISCYDDDIKNKVVFMPLRYINIPKVTPKDNYKYDICFLDTISYNAYSILYRSTKWWDDEYCTLKLINGYPYMDCLDEISDCKYILYIPVNDDYTPVDYTIITEAICSGKQVITFDKSENILNALTKNAHSYYDVIKLVKDEPVDYSNILENWSSTDKRYEEWRQYWMGDKYKQKLEL